MLSDLEYLPLHTTVSCIMLPALLVNSNKMCGKSKRSPVHLSTDSIQVQMAEAIQSMAVCYLSDQGHREELILHVLTGTLDLPTVPQVRQVSASSA